MNRVDAFGRFILFTSDNQLSGQTAIYKLRLDQ